MDMCPDLARKHRVATTSAPGQHPAHTHTHTQPGPGVRGNCPRCVDTIWKEWVLGRSPKASLVPSHPTFPSPLLLVPPPSAAQVPIKTAQPFQQHAGASPSAAAPDTEADSRDTRDTMKSLLPLAILAALAVAALCYGEISPCCRWGFLFLPLAPLHFYILPYLLLSPFSVITQSTTNAVSIASVLYAKHPNACELYNRQVLAGMNLHTGWQRYFKNVPIPNPYSLIFKDA